MQHSEKEFQRLKDEVYSDDTKIQTLKYQQRKGYRPREQLYEERRYPFVEVVCEGLIDSNLNCVGSDKINSTVVARPKADTRFNATDTNLFLWGTRGGVLPMVGRSLLIDQANGHRSYFR